MEKVAYGDTGIMVSPINFGTGFISPTHQWNLNPDEGGRLLKASFDLGINFWDTADMYLTHPHVRKALKKISRGEVVIQTKTMCKAKSETITDVERFLRKLDTSYIDVVLLHGVESIDELKKRSGALEGLIVCKQRGLLRAVGVSTHVTTGPIMQEVAKNPDLEVVLTFYNYNGRQLEGGTLKEHKAAIQKVYEEGKGVCLMKLLAAGELADKAEQAIGDAIQFPYAHSCTIGFKNIHQVKFAKYIAEGWPIDPDLVRLSRGKF